MVTTNPKDFMGRIFVNNSKEDGQQFGACVVHTVLDKEDQMKHDSEQI
jgi:hypothetical protein